MRRVQRAFQTRALVLLVVIASLLTSSCAPGPTLHRAAGVQLAFAWQWVAPSPSYVGMPAADDRAVAATFGHHGVVLLTPNKSRYVQVQFKSDYVSPRAILDLRVRRAILHATDRSELSL